MLPRLHFARERKARPARDARVRGRTVRSVPLLPRLRSAQWLSICNRSGAAGSEAGEAGEERAYPLGREFGGLRGSGHVRGTGALRSSLLGPSLVSLLPLQSLLLRSCLLSRLFRFLRFLAPAEQFSARKTGHVFREPLREPLAKRSDLLLPLPQLDVHLIEIVVNPGHLRALAGQHSGQLSSAL